MKRDKRWISGAINVYCYELVEAHHSTTLGHGCLLLESIHLALNRCENREFLTLREDIDPPGHGNISLFGGGISVAALVTVLRRFSPSFNSHDSNEQRPTLNRGWYSGSHQL